MKLEKQLGFLDVFCICTGAMLSGLFILPGLAYAMAGPAVFISFFLAGLLALIGLLSQAELATAMPKAGGAYFYVTRSMGPMVGTIYGLTTWVSLSLKSAYELFFISMFALVLIHINPYLMSIAFCLLLVLVNIRGVKEAGRVQIYLVFSLLGVLLFYLVKGMPSINIMNFHPFLPHGNVSVISTAGFVFVAYGGLLKVASIAEEIKKPGVVIPRAMILSLFVVGNLYWLITLVTVGIVPPADLANSLTPLSEGASYIMGGWGRGLMGLTAIFAILTASNAGIMAASRYPLALARDGLVPGIFARISNRFKTPHIAIWTTGTFIVIALFTKPYVLVKVASSVLILTYLFACLSIIILRESRLQNYQPQFKSPFYPWIQVVGIIGFGILLYEIGREALIVTAILFIVGLLTYLYYGRFRIKSEEYALLHLIERITALDLTSHSLETELKEIIHERDNINKDRFDHIIDECPVFDIKRALKKEEFFQLAAEALSQKLNVDEKTLVELLSERERLGSTVLNPFLAIPHIFIEGKNVFEIL
ncbi:amino acid permease, partial [PVC group bacterium]|nr:amino acid permease [PVC group bacterium]